VARGPRLRTAARRTHARERSFSARRERDAREVRREPVALIAEVLRAAGATGRVDARRIDVVLGLDRFGLLDDPIEGLIPLVPAAGTAVVARALRCEENVSGIRRCLAPQPEDDARLTFVTV